MGFQMRKYAVIQIAVFQQTICCFYLAYFKNIFFVFILITKCLGMDCFRFIIFGIRSASLLYWKFSALSSSNISSTSLFVSFSYGTHDVYIHFGSSVMVPQASECLFIFHVLDEGMLLFYLQFH
jgi:hypothetical protein